MGKLPNWYGGRESAPSNIAADGKPIDDHQLLTDEQRYKNSFPALVNDAEKQSLLAGVIINGKYTGYLVHFQHVNKRGGVISKRCWAQSMDSLYTWARKQAGLTLKFWIDEGNLADVDIDDYVAPDDDHV